VVAQAAEPTTTSTETETGYSKEPEKPEEKEAAPNEEEKEAEPTGEVEPAEEEAAPEAAVEPTTATTLPFTGLDLRWVVGFGILMVAAGGVTLIVLRKRERHDSGR